MGWGVEDGEWGRTAHVVGDGLVEFELDAPQPVGDVDVVDALDEDGPGVGVVFGDAGGFRVGLVVERAGRGAVDEGAEYLHAFDALACWRRHGGQWGRAGWARALNEVA